MFSELIRAWDGVKVRYIQAYLKRNLFRMTIMMNAGFNEVSFFHYSPRKMKDRGMIQTHFYFPGTVRSWNFIAMEFDLVIPLVC